MHHRLLHVVCLTVAAAALVGCASDGSASGIGARPGDADAAIGDRGPRRTGTATSDAPSVEDTRDTHVNSPVP